MERIVLETPLSLADTKALHAGDIVTISGDIYTARDAAHKRLDEALKKGKSLPFDLRGQIIYYVGPCPPKPGQVIGSAGPTTSHRMDTYTPSLLERGLLGMIGKGNRSQSVIRSMIKSGAVYFACVGGAGALLKSRIVASEVIAYDDLGTEAIRKLTVKAFPAIVAIDAGGNNLYKTEREKYANQFSPFECADTVITLSEP